MTADSPDPAMGVSYFLLLSCLGLAITAQAQDCTNPVGGPNMNLKDDDILLQAFPDGIKVTFVCVIGYISAGGSGVITCKAGEWSPIMLKCERKNCGSGGEVENGVIDYPEGTQFGDKMVISCNTGYGLVGSSEIICGDKGWMGRLPECEAITCDPPPKLKNGTFSPNSDRYQYGEVLKYTCKTGYTLDGSNTVSCTENGEFMPDPPTCVKVDCKDLTIENALWVEGSRPPHGYLATVTYKCVSGYKMKGPATLKCELNSQWSPGLPVCERIVPTTKPTTTTSTTKRPYSTKKPTVAPPDPSDVPDKGNDLPRILGIVFGVIVALGVITICGCWYFGVPKFIKKKKKKGSGNTHSDKEATKGGERMALA